MVDKEAETSQAPGEQTEGIEFDGQETLGTARGTVVLTSLIIEALEKFKQVTNFASIPIPNPYPNPILALSWP